MENLAKIRHADWFLFCARFKTYAARFSDRKHSHLKVQRHVKVKRLALHTRLYSQAYRDGIDLKLEGSGRIWLVRLKIQNG